MSLCVKVGCFHFQLLGLFYSALYFNYTIYILPFFLNSLLYYIFLDHFLYAKISLVSFPFKLSCRYSKQNQCFGFMSQMCAHLHALTRALGFLFQFLFKITIASISVCCLNITSSVLIYTVPGLHFDLYQHNVFLMSLRYTGKENEIFTQFSRYLHKM